MIILWRKNDIASGSSTCCRKFGANVGGAADVEASLVKSAHV